MDDINASTSKDGDEEQDEEVRTMMCCCSHVLDSKAISVYDTENINIKIFFFLSEKESSARC